MQLVLVQVYARTYNTAVVGIAGTLDQHAVVAVLRQVVNRGIAL